MAQKVNITKVLPVLMAFFVMSFVDLVGIGVDRVSSDFNLSATMAQLIPSAAFLWFLLLSVPVGILQSRLGKKFMLNIGMLITALGMLVPFFIYNFAMVLVGFALLGIGNTIVQVSANPLLIDVVPGNRSSSFLSFSQFVKAIGSMLAPPLAAMFAARMGDWKILFLAFGIVSILSVLWLGVTKVEESKDESNKASIRSAFKLLKHRFVLLMVLSIFVVVGIDVGFNSNSGQFLINSFGFEQTAAESGRSFYFFGRMVGTFGGALLLTKFSSRRFFLWSTILGIISFIIFLSLHNLTDISNLYVVNSLIVIIGLAVANIFPLVFSITVAKFPARGNEISGLMMMAISGGAIFPPIMGWVTDISNNILGMSVLLLCMIYLFVVASWLLRDRA